MEKTATMLLLLDKYHSKEFDMLVKIFNCVDTVIKLKNMHWYYRSRMDT